MDRDALATECVRIENAGGSVLDFLRGRGCISPWGTWYRLQLEELGRKRDQVTDGKGKLEKKKEKKRMKKLTLEGLKKNEPETKPEEEPDTGFVPAHMLVSLEEAPEVVDAPVKIQIREEDIKPRPVTCGRFDISAVRSAELGEFYYDQKCGTLDWRDLSGDEISMAPIGWRNLLEDLPKIMDILGI